MTIESVAANTARNGAGAAQPGPRPGDRKPARPGGATTNTPVPPRHSRRPHPGEVSGAVPGAAPAKGQSPGQRPRAEPRGERSLYDGGSPSANRLGPAKAMRARDVSRG